MRNLRASDCANTNPRKHAKRRKYRKEQELRIKPGENSVKESGGLDG